MHYHSRAERCLTRPVNGPSVCSPWPCVALPGTRHAHQVVRSHASSPRGTTARPCLAMLSGGWKNTTSKLRLKPENPLKINQQLRPRLENYFTMSLTIDPANDVFARVLNAMIATHTLHCVDCEISASSKIQTSTLRSHFSERNPKREMTSRFSGQGALERV
ncbi:hypothetical protein RRG08_008993 [Elysia crispata]|uniref:Uncharacterized protein n=1 Tax=Elysia crispata TaxID=231223 RepID=A0AAE1D4S0_9GAST|nr:hypothetical protein RRG08_008993 [Elysia crispata]